MSKTTVKDLRDALKNYNTETEITFSSSTYSKRPLIFYRFKRRGENLLQIELNELDDISETFPEFEHRITVQKILDELAHWKDTDEVTFGATIDAKLLELRDITEAVSFNLNQQ